MLHLTVEPPTIDDLPLEKADTMRFLGIAVDRMLSSNTHYRETASKATQSVDQSQPFTRCLLIKPPYRPIERQPRCALPSKKKPNTHLPTTH